MNIYYETDYGSELYHAGDGSGQRKNHKYIARVKEGNKYRYFYTQAELNAYKNGRVKSTSSEKEYDRRHWSTGEKVALIAANIVGGSRAASKVSEGLLTRRDLHSQKTQLDVMKKREKLYREQGEKKRDYELVNKANRLQRDINSYQKIYNKKQKQYGKTLVGKADKLISSIGSIPAKTKKLVSNLSKVSVRDIVANNSVTKFGRSLLGKLLGKKEPEKTAPKTQDKDLTVNGINIKIRR